MTNEYSTTPELTITTGLEDGATVIVVAGEIDASNADHLREAVVDALDARSTLVIDLAGVTFMDSSGLSVLNHALTQVAEQEGKLTLRAPSSSVRRLLEITGLTDRFFTTES